MLFAEMDGEKVIFLMVAAWLVMQGMAKAYKAVDKDGHIHDAAKNGIIARIKRHLGG
jgi:hypothetical protein